MPIPELVRENKIPSEILDSLLQNKNANNITHEISQLRNEIAALRAELAPVPSLILTGRKIIDEFERLQKGLNNDP
jgi:hypothetical protein